MKNSNDTIGNRTRDPPAFSAVPQPTAPPRAPHLWDSSKKNSVFLKVFDSFTPWEKCMNVADMVLCDTAFLWFLDDSPL
jgi:hypothetical protein